MQIIKLETIDEIKASFHTFLELRPHLKSVENFISMITNQQKQGYEIFAIYENDEVAACIGLRIMNTLAWGKILYIDDLVTKEKFRCKGYGKALLDYAKQIAVKSSCAQIHLDTGYARYKAHKLYLNYGFELNCHHLRLNLDDLE